MFPDTGISQRRLGEFVENTSYRSRVMPAFIKNIMHLFHMQAWLGENWIIKVQKSEPPKPSSILSVTFKSY